MNCKYLMGALLCCLFSMSISAQEEDDDLEQYLDQTAGTEDFEDGTWGETYESLDELAENPIDINTATRDDLSQLPFLSDQEIEDIQYYIYRNGRMRTLHELAMIRSLSAEKRRLLRQFVCIRGGEDTEAPSLAHMMKYGQHTLMFTGKIPFYERAGDKDGYLGYPYKHNLRYTFAYRNLLKAGIVGAQDAGEPFFANRNKLGYDYYSFYVTLRDRGRLRNLTLGRYRVNFGLGLVVNNGFTLGKLGMLSNLGRSRNDITPHSSTMQANYLQGAATTLGIAKHTDLSAFASWRYIDATLGDSGTIRTIRTDGYHRTQSEMDKKNNAEQTDFGARLQYRRQHFHLAVNAVYTHFNRSLQPAAAVYRQYYPRGDNFTNASADYGIIIPRFSFNGETAINKDGALATINTLSYRPANTLTLLAVQRFYGKKYNAIHAKSFSDGGRVQNESGCYVGADWMISPQWQLTLYTDYAYFAWPRYQASMASHAWDHLARLSYTSGHWKAYARYRLRRRQRDNSDAAGLLWKSEHRGRLTVGYDSGTWYTRTQADFSACNFDENSVGWMISQQLGLKRAQWQVLAGAGYFNTDDYDTRLYAYEPGMRYSFNFPMFYGEGIRYWLLARVNFTKKLSLAAKLATTDYFDRQTIGTGYQLIAHSAMTDMEAQLRWRF